MLFRSVGNGSLFAAVAPDRSLDGWTVEMIEEDIRAAKELIEDLFPEQTRHSLAFPWQESEDQSRCVAKGLYSVTKNGRDRANHLAGSSENVSGFHCNGHSTEQIMGLVSRGISESRWAVLSFQGVGVGDPAIDASVHLDVCHQLASLKEVTILPVIEAVSLVGSTLTGVPRLV